VREKAKDERRKGAVARLTPGDIFRVDRRELGEEEKAVLIRSAPPLRWESYGGVLSLSKGSAAPGGRGTSKAKMTPAIIS